LADLVADLYAAAVEDATTKYAGISSLSTGLLGDILGAAAESETSAAQVDGL
jgi:hypothetical protein